MLNSDADILFSHAVFEIRPSEIVVKEKLGASFHLRFTDDYVEHAVIFASVLVETEDEGEAYRRLEQYFYKAAVMAHDKWTTSQPPRRNDG